MNPAVSFAIIACFFNEPTNRTAVSTTSLFVAIVRTISPVAWRRRVKEVKTKKLSFLFVATAIEV